MPDPSTLRELLPAPRRVSDIAPGAPAADAPAGGKPQLQSPLVASRESHAGDTSDAPASAERERQAPITKAAARFPGGGNCRGVLARGSC